jgi:hypothetical protein
VDCTGAATLFAAQEVRKNRAIMTTDFFIGLDYMSSQSHMSLRGGRSPTWQSPLNRPSLLNSAFPFNGRLPLHSQ